MKTILVLAFLCLGACAAKSATNEAGIQVSYKALSPSSDNCKALSIPGVYELMGYADDATLLINGVMGSWDNSGVMDAVGTSDVDFGTYCTLHFTGSKLTGVTMSSTPGCTPGWGMGC